MDFQLNILLIGDSTPAIIVITQLRPLHIPRPLLICRKAQAHRFYFVKDVSAEQNGVFIVYAPVTLVTCRSPLTRNALSSSPNALVCGLLLNRKLSIANTAVGDALRPRGVSHSKLDVSAYHTTSNAFDLKRPP